MNIRQTLAQWFYSPGAYGLWLALDDVDNWHITRRYAAYRATHITYDEDAVKAVLVMNIRDGGFGFNGWGSTPRFVGLLERHVLWRKYKKLNGRKILYTIMRLDQQR
jgi:hypothetical protein